MGRTWKGCDGIVWGNGANMKGCGGLLRVGLGGDIRCARQATSIYK